MVAGSLAAAIWDRPAGSGWTYVIRGAIVGVAVGAAWVSRERALRVRGAVARPSRKRAGTPPTLIAGLTLIANHFLPPAAWVTLGGFVTGHFALLGLYFALYGVRPAEARESPATSRDTPDVQRRTHS